MLAEQLRRRLGRYLEPRVPEHLVARRRALGPADRTKLVESLTRHFFRADTAYLDSPAGRKDMHDHLDGRIAEFRQHVVPWLDAALPLDGARILEIGCGTGSSTVAMAEQGAHVTGIDVDAAGVEVAKDRCALYGTPAEFHLVNAVDVHTALAGREFDFVIFFATLEHMTLDERLRAMASTWELVGPGKCWCVIDTPNRLWIRDGHTSLLPFFHWLPDELALRYMRHSPRTELSGLGDGGVTDARLLEFARHGRGVSYHEFDLTLGRPEDLDVVDSLRTHLEGRSPLKRLLRRLRPDNRVERMLRRHGPALHRGFYEEGLNLIIRKR